MATSKWLEYSLKENAESVANSWNVRQGKTIYGVKKVGNHYEVYELPLSEQRPSIDETSIPTMITYQMEDDLRSEGYTQDAINHMTPKEAWHNLESKRTQSSQSQSQPSSARQTQSDTVEEAQKILYEKRLAEETARVKARKAVTEESKKTTFTVADKAGADRVSKVLKSRGYTIESTDTPSGRISISAKSKISGHYIKFSNEELEKLQLEAGQKFIEEGKTSYGGVIKSEFKDAAMTAKRNLTPMQVLVKRPAHVVVDALQKDIPGALKQSHMAKAKLNLRERMIHDSVPSMEGKHPKIGDMSNEGRTLKMQSNPNLSAIANASAISRGFVIDPRKKKSISFEENEEGRVV